MVQLLGAWPTAVVGARARAYVQPAWEDVVFLDLLFPGGVLGHVHLSWLDPLKVRRMSVVGIAEDGRLRRPGPRRAAATPRQVPRSSTATSGARSDVPAYRRADAVRARARASRCRASSCEAFVRGIRTGRPSPTPGEDGARVVRVLDAAQRSLAAGRAAACPFRIR